jgi:hypothetical protein
VDVDCATARDALRASASTRKRARPDVRRALDPAAIRRLTVVMMRPWGKPATPCAIPVVWSLAAMMRRRAVVVAVRRGPWRRAGVMRWRCPRMIARRWRMLRRQQRRHREDAERHSEKSPHESSCT